MEKYSAWRDAGTGIHPFVPFVPLKSSDSPLKSVSRAFKYILVLTSALKCVLVGLLLLLAFLLDAFGLILGPLVHYWRAFVYTVFFRVILFISGFYWIPSSVVSVRKSTRALTRGPRTLKGPKIILSNHVSYLDVLILSLGRSPVFCHVSKSGRVKALSVWSALANAGLTNIEETGCVPFKEFIQSVDASLTVILFPEVTTSNGRGLLKFMHLFEDVSIPELKRLNITIQGLKYPCVEFSPTYVLGSRLGHFFWLNAQVFNTVEMKCLKLQDYELALEAGQDSQETLSTLLAQTLRLRQTSKTASDKISFIEYVQTKVNKVK